MTLPRNTSMHISANILEAPINTLPFTPSFVEMALDNSFLTLGTLLQHTANELLQRPGFTFHHYEELGIYLKSQGRENLLQAE
jgi:hypothetical protein